VTVPSKAQITDMLIAFGQGDQSALDNLLPLVYDELRRQAAAQLHRERVNHTLQPTALVHEVYLRLVNQKHLGWQNRAHFFGLTAQMMRRILVDHARSHRAEKRGGAELRLTLDEGVAATPQRDLDVMALDEALVKLEKIDSQKSRMVELRFFSGLSIEDTAEVMGLSPRTVTRQWQTAKAWLHRELTRENGK
jgi:RNA polymerase sigma factor (TIGR02999 family)